MNDCVHIVQDVASRKNVDRTWKWVSGSAAYSSFSFQLDFLVMHTLHLLFTFRILVQIAPLYIAEIAPKQHRGKLVSMFQTAATIGTLVRIIVG